MPRRRAVARRAGADLIAVDATVRPRPGVADGAALVAEITAALGAVVLADVDSLEAGIAARKAGAAAVATTLSGYTGPSDPPRLRTSRSSRRSRARSTAP